MVKERLSQGDQQSPLLPNLADQTKGEEVPPVLQYFSQSVNIAILLGMTVIFILFIL